MKISAQIFVITLATLLASACQPKPSSVLPEKPSLTHNQKIGRKNAALVFRNLHKGYTDRAQEYLRLALATAPNDPVVLDTAGFYYEKTGDLKLANHYFLEATVVAPYSGITKNNYGAFLCRNGRYKESLPYFVETYKMQDTPVKQEAFHNAQYCYQKMQSRLGVTAT